MDELRHSEHNVAAPEPTDAEVAQALFETEQATLTAACSPPSGETALRELSPRTNALMAIVFFTLIFTATAMLVWGAVRVLSGAHGAAARSQTGRPAAIAARGAALKQGWR